MGRIILKIRVAVRMLKEPLPGLGEDWAGPTKKSAQKAYKKLRETLPDIKTVIKKVIKPRIEGTRRMFKEDPAYPVRYTRAELEEMARNYLKGVRRGLKPEHFDEAIEFGKKYTADKLTRLVIPFRGSKKYKTRGVGPFVARILTSEEFVRELRCPPDEIIKAGKVDITRLGMRGRFRQAFRSRISQAGPRIMKALDKRKVIKRENDLTNKLVNKFIRKDIVPFSQAGPSHLDFIILNAQLYLEIQVTCLP